MTTLVGVNTQFSSIVGYTGASWKVKADAYALYFPGYFQMEHWNSVIRELTTYWQAVDSGGKYTEC